MSKNREDFLRLVLFIGLFIFLYQMAEGLGAEANRKMVDKQEDVAACYADKYCSSSDLDYIDNLYGDARD